MSIPPEDGETVEFTFSLKPTTIVPLVNAARDTGLVVEYALEHVDKYQGEPILVSRGRYEAQDMAKAFTEITSESVCFFQLPYQAFGGEEYSQILQPYEEFGYVADFDLEEFKNINHRFKTKIYIISHLQVQNTERVSFNL